MFGSLHPPHPRYPPNGNHLWNYQSWRRGIQWEPWNFVVCCAAAQNKTSHTHKAGARNTGWNSRWRIHSTKHCCASTFFPPFFLALRKKGDSVILTKKERSLEKEYKRIRKSFPPHPKPPPACASHAMPSVIAARSRARGTCGR